ncbi:hypothetical protein GGP41_005239 [Bipolaris sorokiniana]|uniref:Uncharacterized protein n=2 Tax=Cochliobolus sativus TaxID=45130 RepID=A0A8H5ZLA8_COCSA|nr:uncharacterized protein COCSADRAFT_92723 [Bipolaris sorokiniana ND90Pr]EMD63227.1 hypothetical protein COCSADRAFT_92723 [Bipolaris sorokiniana ND90Pr]KAF5849838.1 hypothetical protein GGP41_005239 [Bipolaris sorokiniana]
MALQIPTVTVDDLLAFHAQHFPHASTPEYILYGVNHEPEAAEEYYDEDDDGLGYYPDGTKRTLTEEQIAMFRHSEIQAILRKRRLEKENGESSDCKSAAEKLSPDVASPAQEGSSHVADDSQQAQSKESGQANKQQWATTSAKSKAKAKRKRDRYAKRRKEVRLQKGLPRRRSGRNGPGSDYSDDESDEWDPWHQANGPDAQKDDTLDLDY